MSEEPTDKLVSELLDALRNVNVLTGSFNTKLPSTIIMTYDRDSRKIIVICYGEELGLDDSIGIHLQIAPADRPWLYTTSSMFPRSDPEMISKAIEFCHMLMMLELPQDVDWRKVRLDRLGSAEGEKVSPISMQYALGEGE